MPRSLDPAPKRRTSWRTRILLGLGVPVLAFALLVLHPDPAWAARGGRIGGGSFRSAPSIPRSYGGGSFRSTPSVPRGYGGGGIGFPFLIPFFGFGGGGLFGFLVLMAVVGLIANALRGGGASLPAGADGGGAMARPEGPVSLVQVQVGLLASARQLQQDLRQLAATADTSSNAGLQLVLQETTLALLRNPDLWVYAGADLGQVPFASAEATFNRLSMAERSKLSSEVTTNVGGRRDSAGGGSTGPGSAGDSDAASDFIVVTLLVATRQRLALQGAGSAEQLRASLQALGGVSSAELLALEVIWQPDGAGDVLSTEELLTAYPDLQHL